MDEKKAIKIIKNEMACVRRGDICDRKCAECSLVMDSDDIISAYEMAISSLKKQRRMSDFAKKVLCFMCGLFFVAGIFCLGAIESGSKMLVIIGLASLCLSVVCGNIGGENV